MTATTAICSHTRPSAWITKWLPIACAHPKDYEAREQLAWAANMAGMSFSETNCNMGHAVAQAAGHLYHIPHGLACGSVCGGYMEYAAKDFPGIIRKIGVAWVWTALTSPMRKSASMWAAHTAA